MYGPADGSDEYIFWLSDDENATAYAASDLKLLRGGAGYTFENRDNASIDLDTGSATVVSAGATSLAFTDTRSWSSVAGTIPVVLGTAAIPTSSTFGTLAAAHAAAAAADGKAAFQVLPEMRLEILSLIHI